MSAKNIKKLALSTGIGAGIGMLSSSLLIFMMAAVLAVGSIPAMLISPVTVIFLAFGGFFGGFASAKLSGEKGLICGMISGIIYFIILWLFGAVFEYAGFGTAALIKAAMLIISSSFGGILGVNYKK